MNKEDEIAMQQLNGIIQKAQSKRRSQLPYQSVDSKAVKPNWGTSGRARLSPIDFEGSPHLDTIMS